MGKIRSGLSGWGRDVAESVHLRAETAMRGAEKSQFYRRLSTGSHSFMSADLTEQESEALLMLLFGAIFAGIVAARLGSLFEFLVGLVVGVALIVAWERAMETKSRQREAIAASVNREASKGYGGYERVEWLNKLLKRAWPYVVSATEDARPSIRDCVEPWLEEYRLGMYQVIREQPDIQRVEKYFPAEEAITCLHVNAISLGPTAPTIQGVKIHKLKEGKIICNVRVEWQSDSHITLGVGTAEGIVPFNLENLTMSTTVRLIFRITESPPIVAAVVPTIPAERKPVLDFSLSVNPKFASESPTKVPEFVTKQLRTLLTDFTHDTILWPHRLVLPTVPSSKDLDLNGLYLRLHGQLSVAVIKGEHLVNLYPYVIIYCRPQFKVRTKSIENTHDPAWNEEFTLEVEDQRTQRVIFQVMNENKGDDQLLGMVAYPLKDLPLDQDVQLHLNVQPRKKKSRDEDGGVEEGEKKSCGSLTVELRYYVYTALESDAAMKGEQELIEALSTPDEPRSYQTAIDLLHPY